MNPKVQVGCEHDWLDGDNPIDAVCGRYVRRCLEHDGIVVLDPDMAAVFPDSAAVNRALRKLIDVAVVSIAAGRSGQKAV